MLAECVIQRRRVLCLAALWIRWGVQRGGSVVSRRICHNCVWCNLEHWTSFEMTCDLDQDENERYPVEWHPACEHWTARAWSPDAATAQGGQSRFWAAVVPGLVSRYKIFVSADDQPWVPPGAILCGPFSTLQNAMDHFERVVGRPMGAKRRARRSGSGILANTVIRLPEARSHARDK